MMRVYLGKLSTAVPKTRVASKMVAISTALALSGPASAATGNVTFNGNINSASTCTVIVNNNGTLGVSGNVRQLSSKIAGGTPGRATILQNGVYDVSATTPANFSVGPTGADTGVTRQVRFSGVATNIATGFSVTIPEMNASPGFRVISTNINSRVNLNLHFIADRPTSFPSGPYQATVILRCE